MAKDTIIPDSLPLPVDRDIYFTEQVDQESIAKVTKKIIEINESDRYLKKLYKLNGLKYKARPIKIMIDSFGGQCYQCMGLIGVMEKSKTQIHTIAVGAAMSCGFIILISGHKRFAYEHATPLYHQVSSVSWGKAKDMEEDLAQTKRLQAWVENQTLAKTKITAEKLKENFEKKIDWFMTALESLELGVIDEII